MAMEIQARQPSSPRRSGIGFGIARPLPKPCQRRDGRHPEGCGAAAAHQLSGTNKQCCRSGSTSPGTVGDRRAGEAERRFGKLHIACNNAGVRCTAPGCDVSVADWAFVMGVNVWASSTESTTSCGDPEARRSRAHRQHASVAATQNAAAPIRAVLDEQYAVLSLSEALEHELEARMSV